MDFVATLLLCSFIFFVDFSESKVALVLSGGGAKGAFELGVLRHVCETDKRNSWDMVLGTSIGAMNGAGIAQFNKDEQCTKGLEMLTEFWTGVRSKTDVFTSWPWSPSKDCLNPLNILTIASGWNKYGGMCSTEEGNKKYRKAIDTQLLLKSNVKLFVASSALNDTTKAQWFSNDSPDIVDYTLASGALSPIFPPTKVNGMYYVDGAYFHNVPLLKAIEQGAKTIYVILLAPIGNLAPKAINQAVKDKKAGPAALTHFYHVTSRNLMLSTDLRIACLNKQVSIRAIIPRHEIGDTIGFTPEEINKMIDYGYEHSSEIGFEDLCAAAARTIGKEFIDIQQLRTSQSTSFSGGENILIIIGLASVGFAIGAFTVFTILNKRRKMLIENSPSNDFHEIPLP
eukprot:c20847_g1_i1.p1 GENE.c20847_g1_i1~~c20847_g1_i1.p1  ORF type:complete len:398 (-),score=185.80 c20847_g1_i1:870-2063(-)